MTIRLLRVFELTYAMDLCKIRWRERVPQDGSKLMQSGVAWRRVVYEAHSIWGYVHHNDVPENMVKEYLPT